MSALKHTPGPWAEDEITENWITADNGRLHIATVARAFDGDFSKANARLIVTAPKLLDFVKKVAQAAPAEGDTVFAALGVEAQLLAAEVEVRV